MLEWHNLSFSYQTSIFNNVDLQIKSAQKYFVAGKNGSGKSTFLKLCMSYIKPQQGYIKNFSNDFAYVPASNQLSPALTTQDLIEIYGSTTTFYKSQLYNDFQIHSLQKQDRLNNLSSGQIQRLLLALSLHKKSNILYLDEPFAYLDYYFQNILVQSLNQYKKTVFIVSHNLQFALDIAQSHMLLCVDQNILDLGLSQDAIHKKEFEKTFQIQSHITDNPINGQQLLVIANDERK